MQADKLSLSDFWKHCAVIGPVPAANYRTLLTDVAADQVWGGWHDGQLHAIGGVMDLSGAGVAWLSVPGGGLGPRAIGAVRAMRRALTSERERFPAGIVAYVDDDNREGQRLARALGFQITDDVVAACGLRAWRLVWRTH